MTSAFDVFGCDLAGINLIEASAGTGKTWNICALYMRLLLERALGVQQILVVTFTNAATAELRDRVRKRIVETRDYVQARGPLHDDAFVRALVTVAEASGVGRQEMIDRLELALQSFDEAAIFTIHGFCQRALADAPFAAGAPFEVELLPNDNEIQLEVAQDFWRRRVADRDCPPALAAYLAQRRDSPDSFAKLLKKRIAKPLAQLRFPDDLDSPVMLDVRPLELAYAQARSVWQGARNEIAQTLDAQSAGLNRNQYKAEWAARSLAEWEAHFALGNPFAPLSAKGSRLEHCRASRLKRSTNKNQRTPSHEFCDAVEAVFHARENLDAELERARLVLVRDLLRDGPAAVRTRKRKRRVLGYDDILFDLYAALQDGRDTAGLADTLRARFPAALVDEFQDTDPVQFGIFRAIYGTGAAPVFLVGDPKQAIYSFRNADLHTYLQARALAHREYTLTDNQRSTPSLIDAVNALFVRNPNAFVLPGLAYHAVRAGAKVRVTLREHGACVPQHDARVWMLPNADDGKPIARRAAFDGAVMATAGEISRLLREAQAGGITYGERALQPGDIAVLVRSHAQGTRIREQLRKLGIGSVEVAQASVFASNDAEEIERVLMAVLEPARIGYVKGALATEMLGFNATAVDALSGDDSGLVTHIDAFARFRETWLAEGFGVMYRKLLSERGVTGRMLARPDGERRLTNLLHLGELLHDAARMNPAPDALLRWLHAQRAEDAVEEIAQLRLESDRNLVQIVTVHKAKGLEYPVVFCPFLWDGYRFRQTEWAGACTYHDAAGAAVVDFRNEAQRGDDMAWVEHAIEQESLAEIVRVLYVAMTRASHRSYVVAGCYGTPSWGKLSTSESTRSMLNWLAAGAGTPPEAWCKSTLDPAAIAAAWSALGSPASGSIDVAPLPSDPPQDYTEATPAASSLVALAAPPVPRAWRIGSYTSLAYDVAGDSASVDHDTHVAPMAIDATPPIELARDDILAFPRGPLAGECLHAALERIDFSGPDTWKDAIDRALAGSPYRAERGRLVPMVERMVRDVVQTPLQDGLRLADVPLSRRMTELEFSLPAAQVTAGAMNALLARHGYAMQRLAFADLEGYLKGFIDVVVEHAGRFYIVDWKSNHLGYAAADYARARLDHAMAEHGYHLQHLLYTLAVDRYLTRRMPRYDYEQHFGGVLYLFVRGVRPDWQSAGDRAGVWFHRPAARTLQELDSLFGAPERIPA